MMDALKGALTKGYRGLRAFEEGGGGLRKSKKRMKFASGKV